MIAYNKTDAQATFAGLADILEKVAAHEIVGNKPISNADVLKELRRIVEADPTANPIRKAFETARGLAANAGDKETEGELRTRHVDLIAAYNTIPDADDQADAGKTYQRRLKSHAAWVRGIAASIDETGRREASSPTRARSDEKANESANASKVADAVCRKLKPMIKSIADDAHGGRVAAEASADNTDAIRTELDGWREYVKNLLDDGGEKDADDETPKKKRGKNIASYKLPLGYANVKTAIVKVWNDFRKGDTDCEMPDSTLRVRGQVRSYAECIDRCGDTIIWKEQTLREILTVPECGKTPAEVFEKIIHSSSESARQKVPASDYSAKFPTNF